MSTDKGRLTSVLTKYQEKSGMLIQALLDVQHEFNWIPADSIAMIAAELGVPLSRVYRVASFYKAISLKPRGRHIVKVCLGTACHVRGGEKLKDRVEDLLGLTKDDTTADMKFTLERVNCLGCCALGPVMVVDGVYHGKMEPNKVSELLNSCK
jgi:NADH-quinone oxidoreductase subunit E